MPPRMMDGAAQIAATYLPASAIVRTASVTRLSAYRLVVPWHAARQNEHIGLCKVNLVHGQVGYDIDAACTAHGCTGHTDQPGLHACAAQKIDRSQRLDFLEALCQ